MFPDRRHDHAPHALVAFLLLLSVAGGARCQTSADLTLVSEYAARGVALRTRPTPQLRVEHDADAGWYAGGFASPVDFYGHARTQLTAYGGVARRLSPTLSWDAGVTRNTYAGLGARNYHEFYAGLALPRASARLFYSPAYYGEGRSLYLDLGGGYPLGEALRLTVHAGLMHPMGGYRGGARDSADARIALVADVGDCTVQAGWLAQSRSYLAGFPRPRAFTASVSLHF